MAITAWHKNVQRKNTLTYAVGPKFGGQWAAVLDRAIVEFNQLMTKYAIKLSITKVEQGRGPHILLDTEPGDGLHGRAPSQLKVINGKEYMDEVRVIVPATPRIDPKDPKSREVGPGVRLTLLVHELIHAVGLSNDEHTTDDVFSKKTLLIPKGNYLKSGEQVTEDRAQPFDGSAPFPPLRLSVTTVDNLKKAWTAQ